MMYASGSAEKMKLQIFSKRFVTVKTRCLQPWYFKLVVMFLSSLKLEQRVS